MCVTRLLTAKPRQNAITTSTEHSRVLCFSSCALAKTVTLCTKHGATAVQYMHSKPYKQLHAGIANTCTQGLLQILQAGQGSSVR
jgi:hypothetical protein